MGDIVTELNEIKEVIDEKEKEASRVEGKLQMLFKELKESFDCDSLEDGKLKQAEIEKEIETVQKKRDALMDKLRGYDLI